MPGIAQTRREAARCKARITHRGGAKNCDGKVPSAQLLSSGVGNKVAAKKN